jgi:perosamine synthetase
MHQQLTMELIPIAGPWITQKEIDYVNDAVSTAWYGQANKYNQKFEEAFAAYVGTRFAVALPSCTSAIHLALVAAGIGPGDEVIVPDVTWIASAAPVTYVGATTVFADVEEHTWCLSADSVERWITPRTKAIIPVDLYGGMPDWERLRALARDQKLFLLEDAAEAVGSVYRGQRAGSLGDVGVFSFHGSKTLTTGEGGMLVTDREDLYRRVLVLRDHGRTPGDRLFFNQEVAWKYKMSSLQAALGLAQLERIDELVNRKRSIFSAYAKALSGVAGVTLNAEPEGILNSYWMTTVMLDKSYGLTKTTVMERLEERGIATRPFFHPLSSLPAYASSEPAARAREQNQTSYAISPFGVNLPSNLQILPEQIERVSEILRELLATVRAG